MKDRLFEIWLALRCGPASTEFRSVLEHFGTPYDVFTADESELENLPCSPRLRQALADKSLQESSRIMEFCRNSGIRILFWQDDDYPTALRPLRDPPILLYCRGRLPDLNRRLCISVVGTRSMSEYGKRMAYKIGYELAAAGAVVVSGLALGNDSVATAGAITAGGTAVAVLGCGIDVVYPKEHSGFYGEIVRGGAILTEYPPGTPPISHHFPVRNRIISGLSQGTVVVEGDLKSGALITAKTAILQGRDIYAFPGNVGETNSAGTNRLISEGAAVALRARDVLENYSFLYRDALDMNALLRAERNSDLNGEVLSRLGVYTRTSSPETPDARRLEAAPRDRSTAGHSISPPTSPPSAPRPDEPKPAPHLRTNASPHGDASRRALASLTDIQRAVFEAIPLEGTVPPEHLVREGFSMSDIMASVTILEIKGLIVTLPGGLIGRK